MQKVLLIGYGDTMIVDLLMPEVDSGRTVAVGDR